MSSDNLKKAYVVQRINWVYNDEYYDPGLGEPVKAFRDRRQAEAYRLEQEEAARREHEYPIGFCGGIDRATSLPEPELVLRVKMLGLPVPDPGPGNYPGQYDWWSWWELLRETLPWPELMQVYDLFENVRFFDITEIEVES
jgi:hypothetical protein